MYTVVANAPLIGRDEKGVETSVLITEFAVIRILASQASYTCPVESYRALTDKMKDKAVQGSQEDVHFTDKDLKRHLLLKVRTYSHAFRTMGMRLLAKSY